MHSNNPYHAIQCRENMIENMKIFTGKMKSPRSFLGLVKLLNDDSKNHSYQTKEFLKDLQTKLYDLPTTEEKILIVDDISNINCVDDIEVMVKLSKLLTNAPYENNEYIEHLQIQNKELGKKLKQQENNYKIAIEEFKQRETNYKIAIENLREENDYLDQQRTKKNWKEILMDIVR